MTREEAKSELMQIYMSLSEEKKQALDVLMAQADGVCDNDCEHCIWTECPKDGDDYKYIKEISKPTGVNIFDFYEDEDKSCDNCKHHLKFMCKKWETCHNYSDWELEELDFVQPHKTIPCKIKVADGEYISKSKMLMFLNDMRFGIAPDETVADDDERREREAQVDVLDDLMEVVEQMPSVAIPPEHDGCKDCRWQSQSETEMPCKQCMHNYKDEWERAKIGHWESIGEDYENFD